MKNKDTALLWLRLDLRLEDNAALIEASKQSNLLVVYILDDTLTNNHAIGSASSWWLHHALMDLNNQLDNKINFYRGDPKSIISNLCTSHAISSVYWNRCYEPWIIKRDSDIKNTLAQQGITVCSYSASLLWEPWEILKKDNTPYKVFTPFYKSGCLQALPPASPLPTPKKIECIKDKQALSLESLDLLTNMSWSDKFNEIWTPTANAAKKQLKHFIENGLANYQEGRNLPAKPFVSRLSPYIHFGQLSVNTIWHTLKALPATENTQCFLSELGWREFSYYLLYHFPNLPTKNFNEKFNNFPWKTNKKYLTAWQRGQTGIPLVDAGMRELWQTGYMHNRVRMICASFLVKNLLIDWREGEKWFWDCLVDADLASNSASWQWVAGCGADAAPYFRVFNPVLQAKKFDPDGEYILKYVPELKALPKKYIACPFEASDDILRQANLTLGKDYPLPIVDLKVSREQALAAYQEIKQS